MSSQGQPTQSEGGYHSQPQKQDPQDGQPQVRVEQHQQNLPQPQWNMGQQHQAPYFVLPPQPHQQMASMDSTQQVPNYGNTPYPPQFQPMSFGGYQFPTPPPAPGYQYPPPPQMLAPSPHPGEGQHQPDQQQGRHGSLEQHQNVAPQDLQHAPQQFQQGPPHQHQNFPSPQQFPYGWFMPGSIGGYNPFFNAGTMMRTGSHEPTPDAPPNTQHRQSGSPAPKVEQQMQHDRYEMGGTMTLGAPVAFQPPPAASTMIPPPVNTSHQHDAGSPAAEPEHANSTNTAPITTRRKTRAESAALAAHGDLMGAQSSTLKAVSDLESNGSGTAELMQQHPKISAPPSPYGEGANHPAFQCSPETQRLHAKAVAATPAVQQPPNIHDVKHLNDCTSCEGKRRRNCDRQWPCVNCCRENRRWSACKYIPSPEEANDEDSDDPDGGMAPPPRRRSSTRTTRRSTTAEIEDDSRRELEQGPDVCATTATANESAADVEMGGTAKDNDEEHNANTAPLQADPQPSRLPSQPVASSITSETESPVASTAAEAHLATRLSSPSKPNDNDAEAPVPVFGAQQFALSTASAQAQAQASSLVNLALPPDLIRQLMQENPLFAQALATHHPAGMPPRTPGVPPQQQPSSPQDNRMIEPGGSVSLAQLAAQRAGEQQEEEVVEAPMNLGEYVDELSRRDGGA